MKLVQVLRGRIPLDKIDLDEMMPSLGALPQGTPISTQEEKLKLAWADLMTKLEALWADIMDTLPDVYEASIDDLEDLRNSDHTAVGSAGTSMSNLLKKLEKAEKNEYVDQKELEVYLTRQKALIAELEYLDDEYNPSIPRPPGVKPKRRQDYDKANKKKPLKTEASALFGSRQLVRSLREIGSADDRDAKALEIGHALASLMRECTDADSVYCEVGEHRPGRNPRLDFYVEWQVGDRPSDCFGYAQLDCESLTSSAPNPEGSLPLDEETTTDKLLAQRVYFYACNNLHFDVDPQRVWAEARVIPALYRRMRQWSLGESRDTLQVATLLASLRPSLSAHPACPVAPNRIHVREREGRLCFEWAVPLDGPPVPESPGGSELNPPESTTEASLTSDQLKGTPRSGQAYEAWRSPFLELDADKGLLLVTGQDAEVTITEDTADADLADLLVVNAERIRESLTGHLLETPTVVVEGKTYPLVSCAVGSLIPRGETPLPFEAAPLHEAKNIATWVPISTSHLNTMLQDFRRAIKGIKGTSIEPKQAKRDIEAGKHLERMFEGLVDTLSRELPILPVTGDEWDAFFGEMDAKALRAHLSGLGYAWDLKDPKRTKKQERMADKIVKAHKTAFNGLHTFLAAVTGPLEDALAAKAAGIDSEIVIKDVERERTYNPPPNGWPFRAAVEAWAKKSEAERRAFKPSFVKGPFSKNAKPEDAFVEEEARKLTLKGFLARATESYRSGDVQQYRERLLKRLKGFFDALKEAIKGVVGTSPDMTRFFLKREPKRGEVAIQEPQISRGGKMAGFHVTNKAGLKPVGMESFGQVLGIVRDLLHRKGFSFLQKVPIEIQNRPERAILRKADGKSLSVGGVYRLLDGGVEFYVDGQKGKIEPLGAATIMIHELGHAYYYQYLPSKARAIYNDLYDQAKKHPSLYAQQKASEDFAEIFTAFVGRRNMAKYRHQGYTLTPAIFQRFKAALEMDPKAKRLNLRAEALESSEEVRDATD